MISRGYSLLQQLYERTIRRHLPRVLGVYNGVITRKYYLLDLQGRTHENEYKQELVESSLSAIETSDTVVEIGGGYGVCTVKVAQNVGEDGRVISFEANAEQKAVITEALELTGDVLAEELLDRVTIRQTVVGSDVEIYGSASDANRIDTADLPDCDVLIMDCEGAELDIVRSLEIEPRTIVVESHPQHGTSTDRIASALSSSGYVITSRRVTMTDAGPKDIISGSVETD